MVRCGFCGKVIEDPREYRGEVVQKFCSKDCRYKYHNAAKKEALAFFKETMSLLKKISKSKTECFENLESEKGEK